MASTTSSDAPVTPLLPPIQRWEDFEKQDDKYYAAATAVSHADATNCSSSILMLESLVVVVVRRRLMVLEEILESEHDYIVDLDTIINVCSPSLDLSLSREDLVTHRSGMVYGAGLLDSSAQWQRAAPRGPPSNLWQHRAALEHQSRCVIARSRSMSAGRSNV